MRSVLLTAALLAAGSASAQPADSLAVPATVPDVELALGGLAAGALSWYVAEHVLSGVGVEGGWGVVAYPVGVAAGVYGMGRAHGASVPFGPALRGAGVGMLFGYATAAGVIALFDPSLFSDEAPVVILGAIGLVLAAPVVGSVRAVRPATIRTPAGEAVPGVRVHVGL